MAACCLAVYKFNTCSLFLLSYFGDHKKYPTLMGHLSTFRALILRSFSPTGCHLFFHRESLLFGKSSSYLLLLLLLSLFLFLGSLIHQKQLLGCVLNDTNIKLTLSSWNQFQKWNHFSRCIRVGFKKLMGVNKNPTDATVCRYLFTAKLLYMFRVSQHPSSGVLKTVPATSGTGHTTCTATPLQRDLIELRCTEPRAWKKLMGLQLIKTFRALPGIRRSNTVCTRTHPLSRPPLNESTACPLIPHFSTGKYNSPHVNKEREPNPGTMFTQ